MLSGKESIYIYMYIISININNHFLGLSKLGPENDNGYPAPALEFWRNDSWLEDY